jgi:hypothetical protein
MIFVQGRTSSESGSNQRFLRVPDLPSWAKRAPRRRCPLDNPDPRKTKSRHHPGNPRFRGAYNFLLASKLHLSADSISPKNALLYPKNVSVFGRTGKDKQYTVAVHTTRGNPVEEWSPCYFEPGVPLPRLKGLRLPAASTVLRIAFAAALTGVVVDACTGRPFDHGAFPVIDGALHFPGLKPIRGQFTIVFARARPVRLALRPATCNGYCSSVVRELPLAQDFIQRGVRIALPPGGSITGTVRHASGKTLPGVELCVRRVETDDVIKSNPRYGVVDSASRYRISGIPAAQVFLDVNPPGHPSLRYRVDVVMGTETRRDILVRDGGWLDLKVLHRSGGPAEDAKMSIKCLSSAEPQHPFPHQSDDPRAIVIKPERIDSTPLIPGNYLVTVTSYGHEYPRKFTIQKGKRTPVTVFVDDREE